MSYDFGAIKKEECCSNNAIDSLSSISFDRRNSEPQKECKREDYLTLRDKIQERVLSATNISPEISEWIVRQITLVDSAYQNPYEKVSKMDYVSKEVKEIGMLLRNWEHGTKFPNIYLSSKTALLSCNVREDGKIEMSKGVLNEEKYKFATTLRNGAEKSLSVLSSIEKKNDDDFLRSILLAKKFRLLRACASEDVQYNKWPEDNLGYAQSSIGIVKDVVSIAFRYKERELLLSALDKIFPLINEK